jgi:hypothetical protein
VTASRITLRSGHRNYNRRYDGDGDDNSGSYQPGPIGAAVNATTSPEDKDKVTFLLKPQQGTGVESPKQSTVPVAPQQYTGTSGRAAGYGKKP